MSKFPDMKKVFLVFTSFLLTSATFSQVLVKGVIDVHTGLGFGIYSLKSNDYEDNTGGALPGLFNAGASYQITDGFFLGLDYERNGFATESDSNEKAVSQNFGLTGGYNFLNKEKNALQVFLTVGTSRFRYDNFNSEDYITSRGTQVQLGLTWKHYFGETFGMFMNFSIPYYSYNEFSNSKGDRYEVGRVVTVNGIPEYESKVFQLTMSGVNFRAGITLKFGT